MIGMIGRQRRLHSLGRYLYGKNYQTTSQPRREVSATLQVAAVGDGKGRGTDQLAVEGLVTRYTYAWTGLSPGIMKLVQAGKIMAWNLPLGVSAPRLVGQLVSANVGCGWSARNSSACPVFFISFAILCAEVDRYQGYGWIRACSIPGSTCIGACRAH